jgi:hypothetical protein
MIAATFQPWPSSLPAFLVSVAMKESGGARMLTGLDRISLQYTAPDAG